MVALSMDDVVAVPDSVLSRELEGETVILNLDTGTYFGLNQVGTLIWSAIGNRGSLRAAFDAVLAECDVSADLLQTDLLEFANVMLAKGLIQHKVPANP
jgi:hypothetical protein